MVPICGERVGEKLEFSAYVATRNDVLRVVKDEKNGVTSVKKVKPIENISNELRYSSITDDTFAVNEDYYGRIIKPLKEKVQWRTDYPTSAFQILDVIRKGKISVDLRKRMREELGDEGLRQQGEVLKVATPMDFASGWLMIKNLGGVMTDAYGKALDDFPLWQTDEDGNVNEKINVSFIAAPNESLHKQTLELINEGFERVK